MTAAERPVVMRGPLELHLTLPTLVTPSYAGTLFCDSTNGNAPSVMYPDGSTGAIFTNPLTTFLMTFAGTQDVILKMRDVAGTTGNALWFKASDTDIGNVGGALRLQSGKGFDSGGIRFREGEGTVDYVQAYAEGNISPKFAIIGNGGGTSEIQLINGQALIEASSGLFIDALGTYQIARIGAGHTTVYRIGAAGMRLSTDQADPVEKLEVDGKVQLKAIAAPGGNPPAGNFWIYMNSADNKLYCKGPSGTITALGLP